ncbi:unnamed protein product [Prorocentrum cordatum]|uniref:Uncharacterized protein n=1 Tax=Prorocentrum cordatum TaxID=2364126 RepID=A0ABN9V3R6_9DINO|nr:unnamed protein product [Polarella glacialis]
MRGAFVRGSSVHRRIELVPPLGVHPPFGGSREAHHARLLPLMLERFLRPGGRWLLSLAIRDGPMMADMLRHLHRSGVLGTALPAEDPCPISWETACVPERCGFCGGGRGRPGPPGGPTLAELCALVEAHEGGAVLLEGRRPLEPHGREK